MAVILKYAKSVYEAKISKFNLLNEDLEEHLKTLQSLKEQVTDFWNAKQTSGYLEAISTAINEVRKASGQVRALTREYTETINEQGRLNEAVDQVMNNVKDATETITSVASTAATIAAL